MQYSATDNNGGSAANQFVITLTGTNDIPVVDTNATSNLAVGAEDTAYTITKQQLLAGFSDPDRNAAGAMQALDVIDVTASNGSITTDSDGNFVFTPTANYHGAVTLSYKVSDGTAEIEASNSFLMAEVNDAPVLTSGIAPVLDGTEDVSTRLMPGIAGQLQDVDQDSLNILA